MEFKEVFLAVLNGLLSNPSVTENRNGKQIAEMAAQIARVAYNAYQEEIRK